MSGNRHGGVREGGLLLHGGGPPKPPNLPPASTIRRQREAEEQRGLGWVCAIVGQGKQAGCHLWRISGGDHNQIESFEGKLDRTK